MFELKNLNRLLIAGAVSLALSACGGGGGGGNNGGGSTTPPPASNVPPSNNPPSTDPGPGQGGTDPGEEAPVANQISGVAAVGAPLVGTVTVKDALGATKTVQIGLNGSYTVDVSDMTAPFVFRAVGQANGRQYVVHSAASEADVDGTINITQLTELVIANIAGQMARDYFDRGDFGSLSKAALDAEVTALKNKLLPVLQALGVDDSVDLLRTPFTPLSSALDTALDILRVSFHTEVDDFYAAIKNIVTQQVILDDLTLPADQEVNPETFTSTDGIDDAASDIHAVREALASFSDLFANGLPSFESVRAKLSADFRFEDRDRDTFADEMSIDTSAVGLHFTDVDVKEIRMTEAGLFATVDFTAKDGNGVEKDRIRNFQLAKGAGGQWLLHGDQKVVEMTADVLVIRSPAPGGVTCTMTGIEFYMEDYDPANNGETPIAYFVVRGPGLPADGLRYDAPTMGGWWAIHNDDNPDVFTNYYVMNNTCETGPLSDAEIEKIPDDARYLVKAYDADDELIRLPGGIHNPGASEHGAYALTIDKRPPTLAEALASTRFPTITSPASSEALAAYQGGSITIEAKGLNPDMYADLFLQIGDIAGPLAEIDEWLAPNEDGEISTEVTLPDFGGDVAWRSLRVITRDEYRRLFMRVMD